MVFLSIRNTIYSVAFAMKFCFHLVTLTPSKYFSCYDLS
nr:MAG TPA: hypothetical protein [Caudoviricetes sp.]